MSRSFGKSRRGEGSKAQGLESLGWGSMPAREMLGEPRDSGCLDMLNIRRVSQLS